MSHGLRHRFFGWWAGVITRFPWTILLISALLAVGSIAYAVTHWKFQSDRNKLISEELEWNRRFIEIEESLPGTFDVAVVVDAGPQAATSGSEAYRRGRSVAAELAKRLAASPHVTRIIWGFDPRNASAKALRIAPFEEFERQTQKIAQSGPLLASPTPQAMLAHVQAQIGQEAMRQFMPGASRSATPAPASAPATSPAAAGASAAAPKAAASPAADDAQAAAELADLGRLVHAIDQTLAAPPAQPVDFGALAVAPEDLPEEWHYLSSENGRLLFLRATPRVDMALLDPMGPALESIRAIVSAVDAENAGVDCGITGVVVMDAEETQAATWDSTWTSALATVLITILLVIAFHGWRGPVLAVASLLFGIAWTYGFLFLFVGHLQVVSVVFNIMLLSLGIAYGIYTLATFELLRHTYPDTTEGFRQTLACVMERVGPGIATGAITTAAAFASTIFTDFTAVAEMGLIAGVGIMLCFLAMFSVFPAMLRLFKQDHRHVTPVEDRSVALFKPSWAMPFVRHPVLTLLIAGALTFASLLAILDMHFDSDLVKLQPRSAPSVQWMERIVRDGKEERVWKNLSLVKTLEQGREIAARFRAMPSVADVGGVGLLFPADEERKLASIRAVRAKLGASLEQVFKEPASGAGAPAAPASDASPDLATQARSLAGLFGAARLFPGVGPLTAAEMERVAGALRRVEAMLAGLSDDERAQRVGRLVDAYRQWRLATAKQIAAALDDSPLSTDDLPADVMANYRTSRGDFVMEVYPRIPAVGPGEAPISPLDPVCLPTFVEETQRVDPRISGVMAQIHWSGRLIEDAYVNAGYVALILVFLLIMLDYGGWTQTALCLPLAGGAVAAVFLRFPHHVPVIVGLVLGTTALFLAVPRFRRPLHDSLLILLPVAMAFAVTFGVMWLIDMPINAANIIVLPLMFGIGVDSGVHVLNRYRQDPQGQPVGLTQGTGKGITVTCLTSVIGFGVMIPSSHRGIASLGTVLALGLALTMFACWTVMPAWLQLVRGRSTRQEPRPEPTPVSV